MILTIRGEESSDIPLELREPIFFLNEERNTFLDYEKNNNELEITQFNFFVGANNSGKSRFMRGLLKLNSYKNHFSEKIHFKELSNYISSIQTQGLEQGKELYPFLKNQVDKKNLIATNIELIENFSNKNNEDLTKQIESLKKEMLSVLSEKVRNEVKKYISLVEQYQKELNFSKEHKISKKNYTPVLRSLLNNIDLEGGRFKEAVEVRYFGAVGEFTEHNDIHTGLELWSHVKDMISSIKNRDIREFEFFLSKFFFGNEKVALVPDTKSRLIHLDFEKQGYRGIHEIGDGIQALIILLFPIFMAEKNEVFFIEEPEMNLHPGFQRIFIETLLNNEFLKQKNLKYFFTTHSNHFLDLTLKNNKVSFFQFKKLEEGKHLIKTKIKPDKEILDELGVNTSSVLLANTSIWVEGPTDRIYLSKFLKLYCEKDKIPYLKEDIDFAFFEYGGNLITHYLFEDHIEFNEEEVQEKINSFALSSKIYLLADNDNANGKSKKGNRERVLSKLSRDKANFLYQNTNVKEIENLLPKKIVKDFMSIILKKEEAVENAQKIPFDRKDYENLGLGDFYRKLFIDNHIDEKDQNKFRAESGTLNNTYKIKLVNFVIDSNYTYEDLIEENDILKKLIEELYNFIKP